MNTTIEKAMAQTLRLFVLAAVGSCIPGFAASEAHLPPSYQVYSGSTHAHTVYTWSHGEQWAKTPAPRMSVMGAVSYPSTNNVAKANWQNVQGSPAAHYALAKSSSYDFFTTTDHSQEAALQPVSPTNAAWLDIKRAAAAATGPRFVGLPGFEHSENNGPGGKGHLNIINSAEYLNALSSGVDLPCVYKWLKTARPNGEGPVVASFNHPGPRQYDDWAYRDPEVTDIVTMLEVINSNKAQPARYAAFLAALDKGWKVAPVAGGDNHGFSGIRQHAARTFVLASGLTKAALLDAMKHRRTYAALEKNIQCRYTVNGAIMGSTLDRPGEFKFDIVVSDPDTDDPKDKITKVDIVKDGGAIVQSYSPSPSYTVAWKAAINDSTNRYFFVRVWNAGGGDTPEADPAKPVAWLAPVWTGR
ncbi:MAG TPA: CehA/McbA family metallohydrolase [Verrucomicrobiae bacterium]